MECAPKLASLNSQLLNMVRIARRDNHPQLLSDVDDLEITLNILITIQKTVEKIQRFEKSKTAREE